MDNDLKSNKEQENVDKCSSSSSSTDFEVIEKDVNVKMDNPVLETNALSEELINDALKGGTSPNMLVGQSIFYDCLASPIENTKSKFSEESDEDEGKKTIVC
jgi:hypothetical protein